ARCMAAVPDETASACLAPTYAANRSSSSAARGPVVSQPERIASAAAATSSSPTAGGWKPRRVSRLDDSFGGDIVDDEAYAVGRAASACDRLLAARAHREHGAGPVGAPAQRPEHRPGLRIHAGPDHPFDSRRLRRSLDLDERARRRDEELRAPAARPLHRAELLLLERLAER